MTDKKLQCWKCAASLEDISLPLSRLSKCKACHADLHVCRICEFFDPTVSNQCREPIAEKVNDKTRSNFCGYLQPSDNASKNVKTKNSSSGELEALFGLESTNEITQDTSAEENKKKLDDLFK